MLEKPPSSNDIDENISFKLKHLQTQLLKKMPGKSGTDNNFTKNQYTTKVQISANGNAFLNCHPSAYTRAGTEKMNIEITNPRKFAKMAKRIQREQKLILFSP